MLTKALATNGCKVYITGRRLETLETTARIHGSPDKLGPEGGSIIPIAMDVTCKESIKGVVDHITKTEGYLNLYFYPINPQLPGARPTGQQGRD